jgi:hypothetical protein
MTVERYAFIRERAITIQPRNWKSLRAERMQPVRLPKKGKEFSKFDRIFRRLAVKFQR